MRFLTADYLFPLYIAPIKQGVLQISDNKEVIAVFENRSEVPQEKLEVFEGILCPGFVNAHCHLELSHMKGMIPAHTGLQEFVKQIVALREVAPETIQEAIVLAEAEMMANGIVAVGDISNTLDTLKQKAKHNLAYFQSLC